MITVNEATSLISGCIKNQEIEKLSISKVHGKILAQDIFSERDQPPFHRMAMDGIAIDFNEYQNGRREYKIQDVQRAGQAQLILNDKKDCIEGMTGGVLPENATAVIRYEDLTITDGIALVNDELVFNMLNNIHQLGSDHKKGDLVLKKGTVLHGPQLGIIVSNGYSEIDVHKTVSIAVISTGDELVDLDQSPLPHQIRRSNSYALKAELNCFNFHYVKTYHLKDDVDQIYKGLEQILDDHDVLILSGGVSAGKFDFLPQVFSDLKIKKVFHKIAQRPGKPFWFGAKEGKLVFALPGNPVSAVTCLRRYVISALLAKELGKSEAPVNYAKLTEDYSFNKALTYFCPVSVFVSEQGELMATPIKTNGSGDYGSLAYSDGILEMDKEKDIFKKGTSHKLFLWGK